MLTCASYVKRAHMILRVRTERKHMYEKLSRTHDDYYFKKITSVDNNLPNVYALHGMFLGRDFLFWKLNFPVCLRAFTVTFEWLKE